MRHRVLLVCVLALVSGCQGIVVSRGGTRGLLPDVPKPTRPVLVELTPEELVETKKLSLGLKTKIQANQLELQKYCRQLEVTIDEYNVYVKVNNRMARLELGLPASATQTETPETPETPKLEKTP